MTEYVVEVRDPTDPYRIVVVDEGARWRISYDVPKPNAETYRAGELLKDQCGTGVLMLRPATKDASVLGPSSVAGLTTSARCASTRSRTSSMS